MNKDEVAIVLPCFGSFGVGEKVGDQHFQEGGYGGQSTDNKIDGIVQEYLELHRAYSYGDTDIILEEQQQSIRFEIVEICYPQYSLISLRVYPSLGKTMLDFTGNEGKAKLLTIHYAQEFNNEFFLEILTKTCGVQNEEEAIILSFFSGKCKRSCW